MSQRTSDNLDLSDTMAIPEDNTDLRRSGTLAGKFADIVDDLVGAALEPGGNAARVWDGGRGDTLAFAVKTTHVGGLGWRLSRGEREYLSLCRMGGVERSCGCRKVCGGISVLARKSWQYGRQRSQCVQFSISCILKVLEMLHFFSSPLHSRYPSSKSPVHTEPTCKWCLPGLSKVLGPHRRAEFWMLLLMRVER